MGISGHANAHLSGNVNRSANDGTITRFGWKAQNKSLLMFAGEAYNVEMGVTNQLFPQERDETPGCLFNATPEDTLNFTTTPATTGNSNTAVISDIEAFANFMRMLAPPTPAPATPSSENGRATFAKIGCVHCHTPSLTTGAKIASGSSTVPSAALSNQTANLYSDLLVHHMGKGLADGGMCVVSMCFLVQNRKNGPGQRMGEIANRLAHLADWTKPTAKVHSWFSDIGRPRLKA